MGRLLAFLVFNLTIFNFAIASELTCTNNNLKASIPDNKGIELFEAKSRDNPKDYLSLNILSGLYLKGARASAEISCYKLAELSALQALKARQDYTPASLSLAQALLGLHKFAEAKQIVAEVLLKDSSNRTAQIILADALFESGEYEDAEPLVAKLTKETQNDPALIYRQAKFLELHGKNLAVLKLLRQAVKISDTSSGDGDSKSWFHLKLGEQYLKNGKLKEAREEYLDALQLSKDPGTVYEHLGEIAAIKKEYETAEKYFKDALSNSLKPGILQALGDLSVIRGRPETASDTYKRAEEAYMTGERIIAGIYAHHLTGFYADSLGKADQALLYARLDFATRKTVASFDALAWALFRSGEYAEAELTINQAMRWNTQDCHLLYHASMIYGANGKLSKSRDFLAQASTISPYLTGFHIHR